jgi:hypothetical protein
VECKGILGCDKRKYILDLNGLTPRDHTFYGSKEEDNSDLMEKSHSAVFRLELVRSYNLYKIQQIEKAKKDEADKETEKAGENGEAEKEKEEVSKEIPPAAFNVNCHTKFKLGGSEEKRSKEEADIADLCKVHISTYLSFLSIIFHLLECYCQCSSSEKF